MEDRSQRLCNAMFQDAISEIVEVAKFARDSSKLDTKVSEKQFYDYMPWQDEL